MSDAIDTARHLAATVAKVTPPRDHLWQRFRDALAERPPMFFLAPSYLGATPDHFVGVVDDYLVVVKRRFIMTTAVLRLEVPPVHRLGDTSVERALIDRLAAAGITTHMPADEAARYGYDATDTTPKHTEAVFRAGDPIGTGSRAKWVRNQLRHAAYLEFDGVTISAHTNPTKYGDEFKELEALWRSQKPGSTPRAGKAAASWSQYSLARFDMGNKPPPVVRQLVTIRDGGRLVGFSMSEQYAPGRIAIVARLTDRDYRRDSLSDLSVVLHRHELDGWAAMSGPDTMLTMGAALDAGARAHKSHLGGAAMSVVALKAEPLTREVWDAAATRKVPA